MLTDPNTLYRLLPAYIRFRDQKSGSPLQQLLGLAGDQAAAIARDLERMYDGWFIETCDEWLIPYIGDLVGVEPAHVAAGTAGIERDQRLRQVLSARAATANAIAERRRKGSLWVLEEISRDAAHWPARAVEFYRRVVVASHIDHLQPGRTAIADLHSARRLLDLDTPFDDFCHLADVRRIGNTDSPGRYGIPDVGLFVWRVRPYSVTATTAYCREDVGSNCFTFSALGNDTQLFQNPLPEIERSAIARAENLPVPITRWTLENDAPSDAGSAHADPALYGPNASLLIQAEGWPKAGTTTVLSADQVIPADLSDWSYRVPKLHVAVDPVLGRIAFPVAHSPRHGVTVTYCYGFAIDLGGGEYRRDTALLPPVIQRLRVTPGAKPQPDAGIFGSIADAYAAWRAWRTAAAANTPADIAKLTQIYEALQVSPAATPDQIAKALLDLRRTTMPPALVVELTASAIYQGRIAIDLAPGETVAIVALPGTRPIIWVPDASPGTADSIDLRGTHGSRVILDGLLIAGRAVAIGNTAPETEEKPPAATAPPLGELCEVWIRHCSLVPGNALRPNCEPRQPSEPSIIVDRTSACLRIEFSITGAIQVEHEEGGPEPGAIVIKDSIVDATNDTRTAIGGFGGEVAYVALSVWRTTIVGRVAVHSLNYAEDSIFGSRLDVAHRQLGCVRFCYVSSDSRTPQRYECQPDGALRATDIRIAPQEKTLNAADFDVLRASERAITQSRVAPRFQSVRYSSPDYLRLTACVGAEIRQGAHDESEMGVYHDLFEPQRLAMLSGRLADFVPASCDAAVIFVT
jgi:hypothetical protein